MKASELRIGNLVMDGKDIEVVNARMISMLENGQADFDPIPLTEEWMLALGFKKKIDSESPKYPDYEIPDWGKVSIVKGELVSAEFFFLDGMTANIKYVHQLQNLYFALAGKELQMKKQ